MLLVLSEIDCTDYLNKMGIYPDELFTDLEMFKNKMIIASDADIIVIFAGSCQFSKRIVSELITKMRKRISEKTDTGINSLLVLSDTELKHIDDYYIYYGRPNEVFKVSKKKVEKNPTDVWSSYRSAEKPCKKYLVQYDCEKAAEAVKKRFDKDDELLQVIQVPEMHRDNM